MKNAARFTLKVFFSFILLELFLHLYNPLPISVKGIDIKIRSNYRIEFKNEVNPKLSKQILVEGNSLGFRGPELTDTNCIKILTVGGSTTRCMYSSNNETWSHYLNNKLDSTYENIWLNNAGFTGHSTFGHIQLLEQYVLKLKPNYVLFLVGINEIETDNPDVFSLQEDPESKSVKSLLKKVMYQSEVFTLGLNLYRIRHAKEMSLSQEFDFDFSKLTSVKVLENDSIIKLTKQKPYLLAYQERLKRIINLCKQNNIVPVFITQPAMLGNIQDAGTGTFIGNKKFQNVNSAIGWQVLEQYNSATKMVCKKQEVFCVDLANKMDKNSDLFWDFVHFTPKGNQTVANIIFQEIVTKNVITVNNRISTE